MSTVRACAESRRIDSVTVPRRLFVAIELAPPLLVSLEHAIAPLRARSPDLAWTGSGRRHLTMKFLGSVEDEGAASLSRVMDDVARAHRPFTIHLSRVGAFPNFRKARVVWLGVEPEPRLELLQHDLEVGAEGMGFEIEGRTFRPHVTLARVEGVVDVEHMRTLARAARTVDFTASVDVAEMTLFESTLAPTGARYRRIHAATLGGC